VKPDLLRAWQHQAAARRTDASSVSWQWQALPAQVLGHDSGPTRRAPQETSARAQRNMRHARYPTTEKGHGRLEVRRAPLSPSCNSRRLQCVCPGPRDPRLDQPLHRIIPDKLLLAPPVPCVSRAATCAEAGGEPPQHYAHDPQYAARDPTRNGTDANRMGMNAKHTGTVPNRTAPDVNCMVGSNTCTAPATVRLFASSTRLSCARTEWNAL
jgi:hypothetical protein